MHLHIQITIHGNASTHTNHHTWKPIYTYKSRTHTTRSSIVRYTCTETRKFGDCRRIDQLIGIGRCRNMLFSTASMFLQRSTIIIYGYSELLWNYMRYGRCRNMDVVEYSTCTPDRPKSAPSRTCDPRSVRFRLGKSGCLEIGHDTSLTT
jgi:hypothetical protein